MSATATVSSRRVVARTLGLGTAALLVAGLLAWTPATVSGWNQGAAEGTLWQLMNGARANNGVAPVQSHGTLVSLARWRSADMLQSNYFSHTIPSCGCLVYTFYDRNGLAYDWAGENIGWNSGLDDNTSAVRVHEQFMASPGHRVNVLDWRFTHGGVGAAAADNQMFQGYVQNTRMYTQLFMQAKAAAPAPAPAPVQPAPAPRPPSQPAPAPAPAPPPASGGGWTAPQPVASAARPAAEAAPAATPAPEPTAKVVAMAAPARPTSTVGIDGVATVVAARAHASVAALVTRLAIDQVQRDLAGSSTADAGTDWVGGARLEVAAPPAEPGVLDGIIGAILGFLFG